MKNVNLAGMLAFQYTYRLLPLLIIGLLLICTRGKAQNDLIGNFFDQYEAVEDATRVSLTGDLLNFVFNTETDKGKKRVHSKITSLRLLSFDKVKLHREGELSKLVRQLQSNRFEPLMEVRDKGTLVNFLIKESNRHINQVVLVVQGMDGVMVLELQGDLEYEDLLELEDIEMEGMDRFKQLPKKRPRA